MVEIRREIATAALALLVITLISALLTGQYSLLESIIAAGLMTIYAVVILWLFELATERIEFLQKWSDRLKLTFIIFASGLAFTGLAVILGIAPGTVVIAVSAMLNIYALVVWAVFSVVGERTANYLLTRVDAVQPYIV